MEIEARVRINSIEETRRKLAAFGAVFATKKVQVDRYFKERGREKETQGPGSALLRLRDENGECFVTIKKLTKQQGVWHEHETKVESIFEMEQILDALNYVHVLTVTKEREEGIMDDITLCLDDIKELGPYLEVEMHSDDVTHAKQKLVSFLAKLDYAEQDLEHRGYVRILLEKQGIQYKDT